MSATDSKAPSLVKVEDCLWICDEHVGVPGYDYRFQDHFACTHPTFLPETVTAVARMGAGLDYKLRYESLLDWNIRMIHSPEEYERTSFLPHWYPRIKDFTPKSRWYDQLPTVADIESEFEWPVFIKGERQTSQHARHLSIIENPAQFRELLEHWHRDPILHWQKLVCRQYMRLQQVVKDDGQSMPKAFEFRSFWWKETCVGLGPYWNSEDYTLTPGQRTDLLQIGQQVAAQMAVTFLVIDLALRENGEWIVIECNDGQDSGYAGVNRFLLWNNVIRLLKKA